MDIARHLYFHIPFCAKLCPYCSFPVETRFRYKSRGFVEALLAEVALRAAETVLAPSTIFLGGGTPTALSPAELQDFLAGLHARLDLRRLEEWTVETNPATVSPRKAALLRASGINRASVGVQSWDDAVLHTLGRHHTAAQSLATIKALRAAGFDNLNIDLMFGVPGQTEAQWLDTLAKTIALEPQHISTYCLTFEEDTPFFRRLQAGEWQRDDTRDAALFEITMSTLTAAGYEHYEISNYARPGFAARHNAACWAGADYLGFGPGAFSTRGLHRWQNVPDTPEYLRRMREGASPIGFEEFLTPQQRAGELVAFGLRTARGVPAALAAAWPDALAEFSHLGLLEHSNGHWRLTQRGKLLADSVAEAFV